MNMKVNNKNNYNNILYAIEYILNKNINTTRKNK